MRSKLQQLNPLARRMARALLAALPQFRHRLEVLKDGDFRTHIRAPRGSKAYGLRVCTVNGEDTWVQFGVPNAFYFAESEGQLLRIVKGLIADRLQFSLGQKKGRWTFTTLVRKPEDLVLKRGETGSIYSWSGTKDALLVPNNPLHRTAAPRSQSPVRKPRKGRHQ